MTDPAPRVVSVELVPATGYELLIDGADTIPFAVADDIEQNRERTVSLWVREILRIPKDVPLRLNITQ